MSPRTCLRAACQALALLLAASGALAQHNLALSQPFTCTAEILGGWTGLVDGVRDSDSAPGCFATANDPHFPRYVVIDLQIPCIVSRIAVCNSSNGNTREVTIGVSVDGEHYEVLRDYIFPNGEPLTLNHSFESRPRRAQFVRIGLLDSWSGGLGGDGCIFLREVEVYGIPTGGTPVVLPPPVAMGEPLIATRSLRLFRRYCLDAERECRIVVLGDSFAAADEPELWPQVLLAHLQAARPAEAQTALVGVAQRALQPGMALGDALGRAVGEAPDLVLITFGADLTAWDEQQFRGDLARLARELLSQTEALVLLVGPPPMQEGVAGAWKQAVELRQRVAYELEQLARLLGLPMLRTEAALRAADAPMEELCGRGRELRPAGHRVVAERLLELLMQH